MNKNLIIALLVALVIAIGLFMFSSQTVKAPVNPTDQEEPTDAEEDVVTDERQVARVGEGSEQLIIDNPTSNASVSSPIAISGSVPGYWFFEATAPVSVVNWDGLIIGEGYIEATSDWMTTDMVEYTGMVEYELTGTEPNDWGTLILHRSNPSGLPENDAAVEIPILLE